MMCVCGDVCQFFYIQKKGTSAHKSKITYQVSTQYASKGKYHVDSDEDAL